MPSADVISMVTASPFRKRCFVIIPFNDQFGPVCERIREVVEEEGLEYWRGDSRQHPGVVMEQIAAEISDSALVVADLSEPNPNVYYEVGFAHSRRGPERTILLNQKGNVPAFDVTAYRHLEYELTPDGLKTLGDNLRRWVRNMLERHFAEDERVIFGRLPRTIHIVDSCRKLAVEWEAPSTVERIMRACGGVGSLAISEHEQQLEPESGTAEEVSYRQRLQEERDGMLRLLELGATLRLIVTPPTTPEPGRDWRRLALRLRRMRLLLEGKSDSAEAAREQLDRLVCERCHIGLVTVPAPNTHILGNRICYETFRRAEGRGFDGTYWTTRQSQVLERAKSFDMYFGSDAVEAVGRPGDHGAVIARLREIEEHYHTGVGIERVRALLDRLPES